ncbi:MAG: hypothetical protein ACFFCW_14080 [Candidatus Hodarchaeota archaeon]
MHKEIKICRKNESQSDEIVLKIPVNGILKISDDCIIAVDVTIRDMTDRYRNDQNVINSFIRECCIEDPRAQTRASDLYSFFRQWSKNRFAWSFKKFGQAMTNRYKKKKHGWYFYYGISLRKDEPKQQNINFETRD